MWIVSWKFSAKKLKILKSEKEFKKEVNIIAKLNHPNIVKFLGYLKKEKNGNGSL